MPVPKKYENLYGRIVGHMQNMGHSLEGAKAIADKAVAARQKKDKKK